MEEILVNETAARLTETLAPETVIDPPVAPELYDVMTPRAVASTAKLVVPVPARLAILVSDTPVTLSEPVAEDMVDPAKPAVAAVTSPPSPVNWLPRSVMVAALTL